MARPIKRHVHYFPHFMNHGSKMQYLQNKYGNDGYATWYKIMERLAGAENHFIDLSDDIQFMFLADYCGVSEDVLKDIIDFLLRVNWLHSELWNQARVLCSEDFLDSVVNAYNRRISECICITEIELMYDINRVNGIQKTTDKIRLDKIRLKRKKKLEAFYIEMKSDKEWEMTARQAKPLLQSEGKFNRALELFFRHVLATEEDYKDLKSIKRHFINWVRPKTKNEIS